MMQEALTMQSSRINLKVTTTTMPLLELRTTTHNHQLNLIKIQEEEASPKKMVKTLMLDQLKQAKLKIMLDL
jgi:hypothetical protein